jgi:predicted RNA-binding Zn-ribbon protein involved in translation (DUF1610 family)
MIMFCIKCGKPLNEGASFCSNCGTPAGEASQAPQTPQAPQALQDGTSINVSYDESSQQVIPYEPPVMEGGNIIIPVHRRYRIFCPDCGHVTDNIKKDTSAGYPCPVCGKAYAYAGQLLMYRQPDFYPLHAIQKTTVMLDGRECGDLVDRDPVRLMLGPGTHMVTVGGYGLHRPQQYQITVTPEFNTFAFKFQLVYTGPFTYPGRGTINEFKPCRPEDIPNI